MQAVFTLTPDISLSESNPGYSVVLHTTAGSNLPPTRHANCVLAICINRGKLVLYSSYILHATKLEHLESESRVQATSYYDPSPELKSSHYKTVQEEYI